MIDFERLFNLRAIKYMLISMAFVAILLLSITNVPQVLASKPLEQIRFLYIREWVFFQEDQILCILYYIAFIGAMVGSVVYFRVVKKLAQIKQSREQSSMLRDMLLSTMKYMGLGIFIEGWYLVFRSDFQGAYEVIFQFYIPFDTIAMVIFIAIGFTIFMAKELLHNRTIAIATFILSLFAFVFGYIMMLLYGINIQGFAVGITLTVALMAIESLIVLVVAVKILSIRKKVEEEKKALGYIALQLILVVISIFLLIACGLTVTSAVLLNRLFRVFRIGILIAVGLLSYPAFIEPALKKSDKSLN